MDSDSLVNEQLADAEKLLKQLAQGGFEVMGACLLKSTENGRWYFYLVSPIVETEGIMQAYAGLHAAVGPIPQPYSPDRMKVRPVGPTEPIARDILKSLKLLPGLREGPNRWGGIWLEGVSLEDGYLFPAPVAARG